MGRKEREEHWRHQEALAAKAEKVLDRASKKGAKEKTWRRVTADFIAIPKLCGDCSRRGYVSVASKVAHIADPKTDRVLFWDRNNWITLCESCYERKIADCPLVVLEPISTKADLYLVED
ncbi:hypothetical protein B7L44_10265 [Acinetobacter nosocomialis]|uniref:hypothetical protein n=1 Tax=Acinetobacter nosocomialis TaxID=106654 RepID=UPI0009E11F44|nr:hypothetical protein [Acinetobacter nosocomialis]ARG16941.1 hypothetical protein B7L44_10265 [Acinetobacter nosocomialis]